MKVGIRTKRGEKRVGTRERKKEGEGTLGRVEGEE